MIKMSYLKRYDKVMGKKCVTIILTTIMVIPNRALRVQTSLI